MKPTDQIYYTLTRDQIQAIATRAAEIAIEQALADQVPTFRSLSCRMAKERDTDAPELTQAEKDILDALFRP